MMTLTKYGIREWGVGLVAAVVLLAGCCWLGAAGHPGWGAGVGVVVVVLFLALAAFFRNPSRRLP